MPTLRYCTSKSSCIRVRLKERNNSKQSRSGRSKNQAGSEDVLFDRYPQSSVWCQKVTEGYGMYTCG